MRRLAALAASAALLPLAAAGCGGDDGTSPLDDALGYLPENAPLAVVVETDPDGEQVRAAQSLLGKFPFGDQALRQLEQALGEEGTDFNRDIEPLLGNELVIGSTDARDLVGPGEKFVAALRTRDQQKLRDLIERGVRDRDLRQTGESNGATLYQDEDGDFFATKESMVVVADSRPTIERALQQRDEDGRLDEDTFNEALADLPTEAAARLYADAQLLLRSDPDAREARRIPWVAALRTLGMTGSLARDAVTIDFSLATEAEGLEERDLPLAPGDEASSTLPVERGEASVSGGLRNLTHLIRFSERAGRAVNPAGFGQYEAGKRQLGQQLDVDLDRDLIDQLTGDTSVLYALDGSVAGRAALKDPRRFAEALGKLRPAVPSFLEGAGMSGVEVRARGNQGLYTLTAEPDTRAVFGVIDDQFVVAEDARQAARVAGQEGVSVEGARGALAATADAESLANAVIGTATELEGLGASLFTGPLGRLDASLSSSTERLRGRVRLGVE